MPYELIYEWSSPIEMEWFNLSNRTRRGTWQCWFTFFLDEYDTEDGKHWIALRVETDKKWKSCLIDYYDSYEQLEDYLWTIVQFLLATSKPIYVECD